MTALIWLLTGLATLLQWGTPAALIGWVGWRSWRWRQGHYFWPGDNP